MIHVAKASTRTPSPVHGHTGPSSRPRHPSSHEASSPFPSHNRQTCCHSAMSRTPHQTFPLSPSSKSNKGRCGWGRARWRDQLTRQEDISASTCTKVNAASAASPMVKDHQPRMRLFQGPLLAFPTSQRIVPCGAGLCGLADEASPCGGRRRGGWRTHIAAHAHHGVHHTLVPSAVSRKYEATDHHHGVHSHHAHST